LVAPLSLIKDQRPEGLFSHPASILQEKKMHMLELTGGYNFHFAFFISVDTYIYPGMLVLLAFS
jgi:hypothetical protein